MSDEMTKKEREALAAARQLRIDARLYGNGVAAADAFSLGMSIADIAAVLEIGIGDVEDLIRDYVLAPWRSGDE